MKVNKQRWRGCPTPGKERAASARVLQGRSFDKGYTLILGAIEWNNVLQTAEGNDSRQDEA